MLRNVYMEISILQVALSCNNFKNMIIFISGVESHYFRFLKKLEIHIMMQF